MANFQFSLTATHIQAVTVRAARASAAASAATAAPEVTFHAALLATMRPSGMVDTRPGRIRQQPHLPRSAFEKRVAVAPL